MLQDKIKKKIVVSVLILMISFVPLNRFEKSQAWASESFNGFGNSFFTTHHWLVWEALTTILEQNITFWIEQYKSDFLNGVEACYDNTIANFYDVDISDYGTIDDLKLTFDSNGSKIVDDSLMQRSKYEYTKIIFEQNKENSNYTKMAFYIGALCGFISEGGFWGTLWNENYMGGYNSNLAFDFQEKIEKGCKSTYVVDYQYSNEYFNLNITISETKSIEETLFDLGVSIFPLIESFQAYYLYGDVNTWNSDYYQNTTFTLVKTVEAIRSVLLNVTNLFDFPKFQVDDVQINYNNNTGQFWVDEFVVIMRNDTENILIDDDSVVEAYFQIFFYVTNDLVITKEVSEEVYELDFNETNKKWFFSKSYSVILKAKSYFSIKAKFKIVDLPIVESNFSNLLYIDYYELMINDFEIEYNYDDFTLDISNVQISCSEISELGWINESLVDSAEWFLFHRSEGPTVTGEFIGVQKTDVFGNPIKGILKTDETNNTWHSVNNDIGFVFTPTGVLLNVIVQFTLKSIPVGYTKHNWVTDESKFFPYARGLSNEVFQTRDHIITQTKPEIVFDSNSYNLDFYNVQAFSDYNNYCLNYSSIYDAEVYGEDIRTARWKIFTYDGIESGIMGDLSWNFEHNYWFAEGIKVAQLPDGKYIVKTLVMGMNSNFSYNHWGPASDIFEIKKPLPFVYKMMPVFFILGFLVLPICFKVISKIKLKIEIKN